MDKYIAAAFSYLAYNPTESVNDVILPNGWRRDVSLSNPSGSNANEWSGFGAHVYLEGDASSPSQVVIAFRGTEDGGAAVMDWLNNFTLGLGLPAPQLTAAIDRYLEVRKKYPDAEISLTGHSLGGGLASVVAMLFGHPAITFAQAPFELGMFDPLLAPLVKARLVAAGIADSDPIAQRFYDFYFAPPEDPDAEPDFQRSQYAIRQDAIKVYAITGEIVSQRLPLSIFPDAAGSLEKLDINGTDLTTPILGSIDRHSMALHMAGVMSEEFLEASRTVSTLLTLKFDENLYPTKVTSSEQTFLAWLLRKHIEETLPTYGTGDGALKRFSQGELWKFIANNTTNVSKRFEGEILSEIDLAGFNVPMLDGLNPGGMRRTPECIFASQQEGV